MKYWTAQDIADGAKLDRKNARIVSGVLEAIAEHGLPETRLLRIGRSDGEDDYNRIEVDIELVPGVVLPTPYGTAEGLLEGWENKADDVDGVIRDVVEGLGACRRLVEPIADTLDDLRRRARAFIAEWQQAGLPASSVDVRLAPYDHWRGSTVPATVVLFEGLGERLERELQEVQLESPDALEEQLGLEWHQLKERSDARIAIARHGASGTIDQLALNAISHLGDVAAILRHLSSEWRFWLPDGTAIMCRDGHVTASSGRPGETVEWSADTVNVFSCYVPQSQLDTAVGGPLSALLDHELVSADMVVAEASSSQDQGRLALSIRFEQDRSYFCATTGRTWPAAAPARCSENVVPFPLKAS